MPFFLSLSLGVEGLVKLCDDNTDVTMFNLNGFRKASTGVRRYLAVAACASFPLDSASIAFLEDDRLLLVGSDVWSDMVRDVGYVLGLPSIGWTTFANFVGGDVSADDLRRITMKSIHISMAYSYREVFFSSRHVHFGLRRATFWRMWRSSLRVPLLMCATLP